MRLAGGPPLVNRGNVTQMAGKPAASQPSLPSNCPRHHHIRFAHDENSCHRRAAVEHVALFVPWESFPCEEMGDINSIWAGARGPGSENIMPRR
ncbi:hypothetical protein HRG_013544 [Hirsutella rhossiliensis]